MVGCGSFGGDEPPRPETSIPGWIATPQYEDGFEDKLVATSCVAASTNFSADRAAAVAQASGALVRQANVRATSLLEAVQRRVGETDQGFNAGQQTSDSGDITTDVTAIDATRLFSSENIVGLTPYKVDYATVEGSRQLCAMVFTNEENTRDLFERVKSELAIPPTPDNEQLLFSAFLREEDAAAIERALDR